MTPLAPDAHRWIATGPRSDTCARCQRRRLEGDRWRAPSGDVGDGPLPPCDAPGAA